MDTRKARIQAKAVIEGLPCSDNTRDKILLSLKRVPEFANPLAIEKDKELFLQFEKNTCPARIYEYTIWYRDKWGEWDTEFKYLISLERKMYIRDAVSPAYKEAVIKEFKNLVWTGITINKNKGVISNDLSLARIAEHYSSDLVLILAEQYD